MTDARLDGDEYSWENKNENGRTIGYHYTTNYGGVMISTRGELVECCYGIGRNYGVKEMEVQIDGKYFRVSSAVGYNIQDELVNDKRMSRSHAGRTLNKLDVNEVLRTLLLDDHFSYSSVMVKKTLYQLIVKSIKLDAEGKELCKQILKSWRKPIIMKERTPIIKKNVGGIVEYEFG